ncbi:hypothetical protein PtrM4_098810 [Pyrenophora tritici-repentis]|uniref:Uncharacterized protein n=1 Tax=Pyrenophora tritici-repentis TaxID=45151 RepID=A0A834RY11_9PLEO|nr:hypothetical protein PtrM4_098810 [Pyrenophora tritici-repentis]
MLSLFKFASLAALLGLAAAQQQPCYNAADPQDGVGSYCRCADNLCYFPGSDTSNGCDPPGRQLDCPGGL